MWSVKMPLAWKKIIETDKDFICLPSGRVSGKTKNAVLLTTLLLLQNKYTDVIITRSSYGSMADSTYAEFCAEIFSMPKDIADMFVAKKNPLRIEKKDGSNIIYFMGSGGANRERTKGFKSIHPVIAVIVEETQEFKTRESYDQFEASVRRNLQNGVKYFVLGNPPNNEEHWFNRWKRRKEKDNDWLVVKLSWLDILPFLNDYDVKEILKTKYLEPEYYQWLYMGEPTGSMGKVYPMFRKDYHLIPYEERNNNRVLQDFRIVACIIGCDGAVNNDATAFVPRFIMSNGQSVAGKIFYHNPKTNGVKGSFPLVENEGKRWFAELRKENNLDNPYDYRYNIPIVFVVDSAATELIQALKYYMGNRANVYAVKKSSIVEMVDIVQSAIAKNVCLVYDYGGYYNYTLNKWVKDDNILAYQYRTLIWNEKQTGYDPSVPNDVSDADTYGIVWYYRTTENLVWLKDVVSRRKDYYQIQTKNV